MQKKAKILVVDDLENNRFILKELLIPLGYEVLTAENGKQALEVVKNNSPQVILADGMMPEMDGFELARRLKKDEETKMIPIVMISVLSEVEDKIKALEAGADDFLYRPFDKVELMARIQSCVKLYSYYHHMRDNQRQLAQEIADKTQELKIALQKVQDASLETIHRLTFAAEYKDFETGGHIQRMSFYSAAVARKLGLSPKEAGTILYAAPMHDIGKIGIPDKILLKPGKLDKDEWEIMKQHTTIGAGILADSDAEFIQLGSVIALSHHEKWDGTGYPKELKGEAIPLSGRIVAIADVFDALISKRPYKGPVPLEQAFAIIEEGKGTHFDPAVVEAFFAAKDEILIVKDKFSGKHHWSSVSIGI